MDRGGKITFHGPGQLVGYPIVRLPDHVKVVDYVRRVEEALIGVCRELGVTTARVPGRAGSGCAPTTGGPERKVAAIGIRVSRGVTMHGFALNCDVDLGWYDRFVPCGIADAGVTSLSQRARPGRDRGRGAARRRAAAGGLPRVGALPRDPGLRAPARAGASPTDRAAHAAGVVLADVTASTPVSSDGRKMLRLEARNAETPIERKPEWIKTRAKMGPEYKSPAGPGEGRGAAHGLPGSRLPQHLRVLGGPRGDVPHRRRPVHPALRLLPDRHRQAAADLDRDEPRRVAESVRTMDLRYATITGVARDDLPDGGAWLYAETVRAIHELNPGTGVGEPDPRLQRPSRAAAPRSSRRDPRCSPTTSRRCRGSSSGSARASATSARSTCITQARDVGLVTKSNLILGMGETREEVSQALRGPARRRAASWSPSPSTCARRVRHHPVERWVQAARSSWSWSRRPTEIGFSGVLSGPLVRSSYRAGRLYRQAMAARATTR